MNKVFQSLIAVFLLCTAAFGQDSKIFLKAIPAEFQFVDMDQDSDGNTYVLGRKGSNSVVRVFNSAGLLTESKAEVPISNPVALAYGSNGYLYIAGTSVIRRVALNGMALDPQSYSLTQSSLGDMSLRDLVYVPATGRVVAAAQNPGSRWPRFIAIPQALTGTVNVTAVTPLGVSGGEGATARALAVDGQGNVYMVGRSAGTASGTGVMANRGYIARLATDSTSFDVKAGGEYNDIFSVACQNGWIYAMGLDQVALVNVRVSRFDSNLGSANKSFKFTHISNPTLANNTETAKKKFSISADSLDNVYINGPAFNGTTTFFNSDDTEFRSIASTGEGAFVAKVDDKFQFKWVRNPIQSPFTTLGSVHKIAWDGKNSRLWWSGSYSGSNPMKMQEGANTGTALTLPQDPIAQGFTAVFEGDGTFTRVVDFTLVTDYAGNRVTLNGATVGNAGSTFSLIMNSVVSIKTPRTVYRWNRSDGLRETDDMISEGVTIDDNIVANADTRLTFTNFSVNSVVQDSKATDYSFTLQNRTTVRLEWLVEYSLQVDSNFQETASLARMTDGSLFAQPLTSKAAGNPSPGVGKHWIKKDSQVVLKIDGAVEDLGARPGLPIRYVPYRYRLSGSFTADAAFPTVEPRQQLREFTMTSPTTVDYQWKLQYGIDMRSTNLSADPLLAVDYLRDRFGVADGQRDVEGGGVNWFDDGSVVRIGAPKSIVLSGAPQALAGWINGDGYIFNPTEGKFDVTSPDPISAAYKNDGFKEFQYNGRAYLGREVSLDRPARVIWSYNEDVILKTVSVGNFIQFTAAEISKFGLKVTEKPALAPTGSGSNTATAADFVWDEVAKKFFPLRPVAMNLLWPTTTGGQAKVILTPVWGGINYRHIAGAPPVSLISHPPASQPRDFVFQKVGYASAGGTVDDQTRFTALQAGYTVLIFNRTTPVGRGGIAQNVIEVKVVYTKLWNTDLEATVSAPIGQKITSVRDLAKLGTGYVFFEKARYNPFIYNRNAFIGEALWNSASPPGPVIPVNKNPTASVVNNDDFVVLWYDDPALNDHFLWPYTAVRYSPEWPTPATGLGRIVMSSGFGSESVAANGAEQTVIGSQVINGTTVPASNTFDPGRFEQVSIYSQPDRTLPGFNPNEEHALVAPSLRNAAVAPRPPAAYALRENDLNTVTTSSAYTSDPYVLVQFLDKADNQFKMKVYSVTKQDTVNYPKGFSAEMKAGEPVIPFYPLGVVSGAPLPASTYAKEGNPSRLTFWKDHKNTAWAVSGGGAFTSYFYYPLLPNFWWPGNTLAPGDAVPWLPSSGTSLSRASFVEIDYTKPDQTPAAQGVNYTTVWPLTVPTLKVGETLTYAGGEYASDNPGNPGLPGVVAWAAGEVIYDDLNPDMREGTLDKDGKSFERYTARMISALEERKVSLPVARFPSALLPASGRTKVAGTLYYFNELSSSLKKRVFYNPLTGELGIKGLLNDKDIGNSTLTAAPPAVYALEPNILTKAEYEELLGTTSGSPLADLSTNSDWKSAVDALYLRTRNPNSLTSSRVSAGNGYTAGLQSQAIFDPNKGSFQINHNFAKSLLTKGVGTALVTNPAFLDPLDTSVPDVSYVTLAENNDPSLGGSPVVLHVIKVDRRQRYRGAVKVVLSDNVFDENIILRHTGDFGARADDLVFDWWYRVEDGTEAAPPDAIPAGQTNPWKSFPDPSSDKGRAFFQLKLKGNPQAPELLLADSLWYVRYRHKNEVPNNPVTWASSRNIPFEWAGAGNSRPGDYRPQLAQGWVKRVLDAVNPYEARINDFTGDSPATYASMIRQFGQRYEGPVALNPAKNVIENVGLIELYSTVLNRARSLSIDLSTPVSTPGISNALMLASTRLADFYMLLGNEAYTDAQDPTIGYGSDSAEYGAMAPTVFTFQNQLGSQIEEDLALLRGVDDFKAKPVYNRLFWNFTKGEGEAAYATSYNISDVNQDGFINEDDAMILYPQGHGDAWGHYLTAIGGQYELLRNPFFNWVSRSELYNLQNIVFKVDFLDERKFAQVAAAKAKAGAEIVANTYSENYVADPEAQWQGYLDTDTKRAWGVEEWARRAGQGGYFDWVTANALIPSVHPNTSKKGIEKVDRTTVKDIAVVSANMSAIQQTFDDANQGYNPLGIAGNTVPFDIDPNFLEVGSGTQNATHFKQIYSRAVTALNNAGTVFNNANKLQNMLRSVENNEVDLRRSVFEQDLAYRNQLIEIFGSPYAGTIGAGMAYPAGYRGPDTSLYMYVDKQSREITAATVPGISASFRTDLLNITNDFSSFTKTDFRANYAPSFSSNNPADWFANFGGVNYITTTDNGISFDSGGSRVGLANMVLPLKASGYTFEAPSTWGMRASPGQLQIKISEMIQQEAELAKAIAAWDGYQGAVVRQLRLVAAQAQTDDSIRALMGGKIANNTILGAALIAAKAAEDTADYFAELAPETAKIPKEFVPVNLPTAGLAFSPGDALSAIRGASYTAGEIVKGSLKAVVVIAKGVGNLTDVTKGLIDMGLDFEIDKNERSLALKQALVELENMVGDEGALRVEVYRQQEALRQLSDEYRALLQTGARLIDEREAYNKRVAELVQRNRYQDMSFRVSRNAALQRYREAYNLAARYTYLAAKAYDYDTNLYPSDPASPQRSLTKIVGERSLGLIEDGEPHIGAGGLAEELAKLKTNYDVLEGRLGINNPEIETGRFSIRKELFRISGEATSDAAWHDTLATKKVDNLWDMPEFRRYCRPFAAYDPAKPEPGLVIDFSSEIVAGKNFFGNALAGGDNIYDPSRFSTKIRAAGAWFEGYVSSGFATGLSETPRIYLVPVGSDVMTCPTDNNLGVRMWKLLDQKIPVPYPVLASNLTNSNWRPLDTLGGTEGELRRFSSFRAYPDSGSFGADEMTFDTRLVGRSVWNTRWLLIIPGRTLKADADSGIETFIDNVTDIKILFQTYSYSGN